MSSVNLGGIMMCNKIFLSSIFSILIIYNTYNAHSQNTGSVTGLPIPRFVSLKAAETNLRKGPGAKYPISYVYKRKGYPMQVIDEFENWRKLKDKDDAEGWVHENLITGARNVEIVNNKYYNAVLDYPKIANELILFRYPDEKSHAMLRAEIGAIGALKSCNQEWCKIRFADTSGWVRKINLWGVTTDELLK